MQDKKIGTKMAMLSVPIELLSESFAMPMIPADLSAMVTAKAAP